MKKLHHLSTLLLGILLGSCQSIHTLSVDYLQPAEICFPAELRNIAVVNNMSASCEWNRIEGTQPTNPNIVSEFLATTQGDGKAVSEQLAQTLAEQNYFDQVIICDSALRGQDLFPRDPRLGTEEVQQLADDLDADLILAVEQVAIHAKRQLKYLPEWWLYQASMDVKLHPVFRVYLPGKKNPLVTVSPSDSIFWEEFSANKEEANALLIDEKELLKEAAIYAATMPIKQLVPTWNTVKRYYYVGGSVEMRDAAILVKEGSWDDALELWKKVNKKKNKKQKMRSAVNIALYYEMHDQLEEAEAWATKALELIKQKKEQSQTNEVSSESKKEEAALNQSQDYLLISMYLLELNNRKTEMQKLNLQMNRFTDDF